jgi:hypothetical protein
MRAARPRSARQPEGVTKQIAVYVGRTLGELLNRKDELQQQLAQVEAQIADVGNDIGARMAKYLPKGISPEGRAQTDAQDREAPASPAACAWRGSRDRGGAGGSAEDVG